MKTTIVIILIFLGSLSCVAQNSVIYGQIVPENPEDSARIIAKSKVVLKINGTKKASYPDKNLNFTFQNLDSDSILIYMEPKSARIETMMMGFLEPNDTLFLKIPYMLTCKYDKSKNNKTCPICKRQDRVIPIVYGLLAYIQKKGEVNKEPEIKEGGCIISNCDPNWYCKRDQIDF